MEIIWQTWYRKMTIALTSVMKRRLESISRDINFFVGSLRSRLKFGQRF